MSGIKDESTLRIEIALRAGMIAKAALEMISLSPSLVLLQINEVAKALGELKAKVARSEEAK